MNQYVEKLNPVSNTLAPGILRLFTPREKTCEVTVFPTVPVSREGVYEASLDCASSPTEEVPGCQNLDGNRYLLSIAPGRSYEHGQ